MHKRWNGQADVHDNFVNLLKETFEYTINSEIIFATVTNVPRIIKCEIE